MPHDRESETNRIIDFACNEMRAFRHCSPQTARNAAAYAAHQLRITDQAVIDAAADFVSQPEVIRDMMNDA